MNGETDESEKENSANRIVPLLDKNEESGDIIIRSGGALVSTGTGVVWTACRGSDLAT